MSGKVARVVLVLSLIAAMGAGLTVGAGAEGSSTPTLAPTPTPTPGGVGLSGGSPVVAAVGDLVCAFGAKPPPHHAAANVHGVCRPGAVANIVKNGNYDAFLPLGDLQYSYASLWRFDKYWNRYYGAVRDITRPVPGNHEGYNGLFDGYFDYFGKRAHPPGGYYSFNIGTWHVIALNTQMCRNRVWGLKVHRRDPSTSTGFTHWIKPIPRGGCRPGDPMYKWARRDLARHSNASCTLALFHHPLYKWYGKQLFNPKADQRPIWRLLYKRGVDVALTGHEHNYERFKPLDASGHLVPQGMVQFTVGTGGDSYQPLPDGPMPSILAAAQTGSYGILQMTLKPGGYDYSFITAPGEKPYQDSGSGVCH